MSKILIVDDSRTSRKILKNMLEKAPAGAGAEPYNIYYIVDNVMKM